MREHGRFTTDDCGAMMDVLRVIEVKIATLDRADLLKVAEAARRHGISIPRKEQEVSVEDGGLWLAVRTRLEQGDARSERDACEMVAVKRGAKTREDMIRARSQYLRTDKRVRDILKAFGLDADALYKGCS